MILLAIMGIKTGAISEADQACISFNTRSFGKANVLLGAYRKGGKPAIELVDAHGELITTLSVNMPEFSHLLCENEFFVKIWNENAEIADDALASGIFRDTGRSSCDVIDARIWTFT
jgi:hypothetical protein